MEMSICFCNLKHERLSGGLAGEPGQRKKNSAGQEKKSPSSEPGRQGESA
jgi:hypothetical protein